MSPITSVSYHIHVPTLAEVQAAIPFDIDPADPRTAALYLLGIVYGRGDEKIWGNADAADGIYWDEILNAAQPVVALAHSLSGEYFYGPEDPGPDLLRRFAQLDVETTTAVLAAMLLFQHINDGTWGPTMEARQAQEEARVAALPTGAPTFDDSSERVEDGS